MIILFVKLITVLSWMFSPLAGQYRELILLGTTMTCACLLGDLCRGLWGGTYPNAPSMGLHQVSEKVSEETVICHSKPASLSSAESSDGGGRT